MQENSTLKERAYTRIRQMLLLGELVPGQRLSNRKLADALGFSMIPVREAITQLASEGLVDYRPGEGCFVSTQSREDLLDLYDLREALECHAVGRAAELAGPEHVRQLTQINAGMTAVARRLEKENKRDADADWSPELLAQWLEADAQFHWTIFQAAGNKRSLETIQKLRLLAQLFGSRLKRRQLTSMRLTLQEHESIIRAIDKKDADLARQVMAGHIRRGREQALKRFDAARLSAG
jgi:DNA-binding GntR family transcriptional regulator